jgi:threonine dehydrogenase-like Zn-dependent dehydrogenase
VTRGHTITFPRANEVSVVAEDVGDPGDGQVLCRAVASLVSRGTETFCLKGLYDPGTYWEEFIRYPLVPGYSMVAKVEAVGAGVTSLKPGDRVTSLDPHRQVFLAKAAELYPVPEDITDAQATWASLGRTTQLAVRRAKPELGESIGVVGLGTLGQLVVQYLRIAGARRIVAIDIDPARVALAVASGATHAVTSSAADAHAAVADITDSHMLDALFEVTGRPDVLAPATLLLRKLGRLVLLGDSPTPSQQNLGPRVVGDSLSILGIHGYLFPGVRTVFNPWTAAEMTEVFFDFIRQKRMDVTPLIARTASPLDARQVYDGLASGRDNSIGIIFDWTRLPEAA